MVDYLLRNRMATLTTPFTHPSYHGARDADREQRERFERGGIHFPLNTYRQGRYVTKDRELRPTNAGEREHLMGYPPNWTI